MFFQISEAKILNGILVGPQIRRLLKDDRFTKIMKKDERAAWRSFKNVVNNFLGNHKAKNYRDHVKQLLLSYRRLKCNQSLKVHFLESHLDYFPENLGAVSDEHGERFHQDVRCIERRYQANKGPAMLADYVWSLIRDKGDKHNKKVKY
jgi:hypothetical protein